MDGSKAVEICVKNTDNLIKLAERINQDKLRKAQTSGKAEKILEIIYQILEIS